MRNVARLAALRLDGIVLEHEGALFIRVALKADGVLLRGCAHLMRLAGAVRVVTIRAVDKPFVHAMVKGHFELGLFGLVAGDAELRLRSRQQELPSFRVVRRMARNATDVGLAMQGVDGLEVLGPTRVARFAASIDVIGRGFFE